METLTRKQINISKQEKEKKRLLIIKKSEKRNKQKLIEDALIREVYHILKTHFIKN